MTMKPVILALDLGTTAFKSGLLDGNGQLVDPPLEESYTLNYANGGVTCDPELYAAIALRLLEKAAHAARRHGCKIQAIGISSQAQTCVPLDPCGKPLDDFIVWTDGRATAAAAEVAAALPDYAAHGGFAAPRSQLFLPKVRHWGKTKPDLIHNTWKFLLLNEYIIYRLTGWAFGDTTNQGMSGFFDIARREYSPRALAVAGITSDQLAVTAPAATISQPLDAKIANLVGLPEIPVFSCGNDQSCSAAGSGVLAPGDVHCNFGTAMVIYTLSDTQLTSLAPHQITGISPLTDKYFLLGVESECGNVLEWLYQLLYPGAAYESMYQEAVACDPASGVVPTVVPCGNGRVTITAATVGSPRAAIVRGLLDYYAGRFGELLTGVLQGCEPSQILAAGGLSRSDAWLRFLETRTGLKLQKTAVEHAALLGVDRIIKAKNEM